MKLNYEDKMRIVEMQNQGYSLTEIGLAIGVNIKNVKKYLRLYRQYGEDVFHRKRFNSEYSPELKLEIIKRFEMGESKSSLSIKYKIGVLMLIKWLRDYEEFGLKKSMKPSIQQNL